MVDAVSGLQQATTAAEVREVSLGLLGLITTYAAYRMMLEELKDHLNQMSDGFHSMGEKLSTVADSYQSIDDDIGSMLKEIESQLGNTPSVG